MMVSSQGLGRKDRDNEVTVINEAMFSGRSGHHIDICIMPGSRASIQYYWANG